MSQSKHEQERQWKVRKEEQHPHGQVKTKKELASTKNS
ncbi:DUF6254 family protein [Bacillus fonticola]|nr:DUF6254 family protein [Bacillus fonticola]